MKRVERIHLLSRADRLMPLREFVRDFALRYECSHQSLDCIVMSVNEACMNVIQHAYAGDEDGEIVIEFWVDKDAVMIRVMDYAEQVDIESIKSRDLDDVKPGGLGVHIINKLMDNVEYRRDSIESGNVLEMRKKTNCKVDHFTNNNMQNSSGDSL